MVTPAELAKRYRFPVGAGAGQTVALIEFGGGYFPGDLKKFCKRVDVPAPKVTTVSIGGASTRGATATNGRSCSMPK